MTQERKSENVLFEIRFIFKDLQAIDLTKAADTTKKYMFDIIRIHVETIKLKKYGILLTGQAPIQDILRIGENSYQLTLEGGLEIVVHINKKPTFLVKEGRILDLREEVTIPIPKFDDSEPDEEEYSRIGI